MSDLISDTIEGGLLVAAAWTALSVPVAVVIGRILRARNLHESDLR